MARIKGDKVWDMRNGVGWRDDKETGREEWKKEGEGG